MGLPGSVHLKLETRNLTSLLNRMLAISVHGTRLKGNRVKLKVAIFPQVKVTGKLFMGEAVEIVS